MNSLKTLVLCSLLFLSPLTATKKEEAWYINFRTLREDAWKEDAHSFDMHLQEVLSEQSHPDANSSVSCIGRTINYLALDALDYFPSKHGNFTITNTNTKYSAQSIRIIFSNLEIKTFLMNNTLDTFMYFFDLLSLGYVIPEPDLLFFKAHGYERRIK